MVYALPDVTPVNLPIGAVAIPFIIFFLSVPRTATLKQEGWARVVQQFDPVGTILFIAAIICLLLSLQWGGSQYPWSDGREIALLTVFGVLIIAWGISQWKGGEDATMPLRIVRQRTVAFSTFYIFFGSASFVLLIYYLPVWSVTPSLPIYFCKRLTLHRFQAIKGDSAAQSGIHNLPTVLSVGTSCFIRIYPIPFAKSRGC